MAQNFARLVKSGQTKMGLVLAASGIAALAFTTSPNRATIGHLLTPIGIAGLLSTPPERPRAVLSDDEVLQEVRLYNTRLQHKMAQAVSPIGPKQSSGVAMPNGVSGSNVTVSLVQQNPNIGAIPMRSVTLADGRIIQVPAKNFARGDGIANPNLAAPTTIDRSPASLAAPPDSSQFPGGTDSALQGSQ